MKDHTCADRENADLRALNQSLQLENKRLTDYVRQKTNDLLKVVGTIPLKAEELDDGTLIEFDPIGIVTASFIQVLANLRSTNLKLHVAHQEIQAIFDSVGAAVLVLDPQRNIIACNDIVRKKMFSGDDEPTGQNCRDVICQKSVTESICVHHRIMESGRAENNLGWEFNGHCFDVIGQPIKNADGVLTHVVLVYSDVTEHRRNSLALENALAETQEAKTQIDGLLKSMTDGLIATDAKGRVVLMNQAAEQLLKTRLENCIGKYIKDIIDIPELKAHFFELVVGANNFSCDFKVGSPDGDAQIYQARTSEMLTDRTVSGRITFLQNVSREREIDRMKDEFLSTAAHQLRTPLASVIGFAELIMYSESLDDDTRNEYIAILYGKAEQLSEIVSNLLDISRIESGRGLAMIQEPIHVDALIKEVLKSVSLASSNSFEINLQQEHVSLFVDRFAMLQVLENLISNAVKYTSSGGVVRFDGSIVDGHYRLSIIDKGIGMTPEVVAQAFNKFYRANASNTSIAGTGLGLTIVRYLVEAHGGSVNIESQPGSGTSVHLTLPLAS